MEIRADFPGGNILADRVEGDTVYLRQDRRTTTEWWFYWRFRVEGAAGRRIRFVFTDGDVLGTSGPCHSLNGQEWNWLGREIAETTPEGVAFTYTFAPDETIAHFVVCLPYTEANLRAFLNTRPAIEQSTLCTTENGRPVELLACRSANGRYLVPLTARLHACETTSNYVLEGMLDFWITDRTDDGAFLRENVDLRAVPLFDKDGVEAGDQGKLRAPHDHNRDFQTFHWTTTGAFADALKAWFAEHTLPLALDLHCPGLRNGRNEQFFLVGVPEPWESKRAYFARLLEETQQGMLRYQSKNDIPWGTDWNTATRATLSGYLRQNFPVDFAVAVENPYSRAGGAPLSANGARAFGSDLARTIARYLRDAEAKSHA